MDATLQRKPAAYNPSELLRATGNSRYLVIGEFHTDQRVTQLVQALIQGGKFSSIYVEQLKAGEHKRIVPVTTTTHGYPSKYETIANAALEKKMRAHGMLDTEELTHESYQKRTGNWLEYIQSTTRRSGAGSRIMLLVGTGHVEYAGEAFQDKDSKTDEIDNIVDQLTRSGVARNLITTLVPFEIDADVRVLLRIGALPKINLLRLNVEKESARRAARDHMSDFVYTVQRGSY
ncbi:MAG: hypothetical protein ACHQX1_02530 [Candidatus Micrarchaeales archaeon]